MPALLQLLPVLPLGLLAGVLSGLLGIGGGLVFSPLLLLLGLEPHQALATSTLAIVPTTLAGSAVHLRNGSLPLRQGLVLLEGGPGTGKTSTVAAMITAHRARQPDARVHLAAPTGKAAGRLRTATGGTLPCTTLHRLLESRGDRFGRHRGRPLDLDLLVVDEVSMVDLGLMGALLEALPSACRLVLVGDPGQLSPIAPGAVLQDLQRPEHRQRLGRHL